MDQTRNPTTIGDVGQIRKTDSPHPTPVRKRRVAIASFSGTLIELYDFNIYGTASALVFPHILFPALGTAAATVASFATLSVAFVARPIGSVLFGHFGDRLGRKKTLIATLLGMGISTVLIGALPTAAQIGIWAPILAVVLRIMQGLAAGGEWAGAALLATEHAPQAKRGFWGMFPQVGAAISVIIVNGTFLLTGWGMSNAAFLSWGWRIPFLASAVLIGVGLYVRLNISETPVFTSEVRRSGGSRQPFLETFQRQPRETLLAAGSGLTSFSIFYLSGTYLTNYATTTLGFTRTFVLTVGACGGVILTLGIICSALLSDRFGRRALIGWTNLLAVPWTLAMFPILGTGSPAMFVTVMLVTMFVLGLPYGPLGAFLPELFQTRYRYTAAGIAFSLSAAVGGAIPPLVAAAITQKFGASGVGLLLAALCLIATVCTFTLRETRHLELDRDLIDPQPSQQ